MQCGKRESSVRMFFDKAKPAEKELIPFRRVILLSDKPGFIKP